MRTFLPAEYRNRKNIKESLRTSHLPTALERLHNRINALGLTLDFQTQELLPHPDRLTTKETVNMRWRDEKPEVAYHNARNAASTWTYSEIEEVMEIESDLHLEQIEALHNDDPVHAKKYQKHYQARMDGVLTHYAVLLCTPAKLLVPIHSSKVPINSGSPARMK